MTPDRRSLEAIEEAFAYNFSSFDLTLPEENLRERRKGSMPCGSGRLFYVFGQEDGREYLEYYRYHHMGEGHARIYDDGTAVGLPTLDDLDICFGFPENSEEEKADIEKKYRATRESLLAQGLYDDEWYPPA